MNVVEHEQPRSRRMMEICRLIGKANEGFGIPTVACPDTAVYQVDEHEGEENR
jgi:hypothetical protein